MDDKYKELEKCKEAYIKPCMSDEQVENMKKQINKAKQDNERTKNMNRFKTGMAVAAAAAVLVLLPNTSESVAHAMSNIPIIGRLVEAVTFRDYQYEDERNHADVEIPEIVVNDTVISEEENTPNTEIQQTTDTVQDNLEKTAEEINEEIKSISEKFVNEFEENLKNKEGYQDILVKSELVNTTEDYFTLKLICYQGAGSGSEWNYYYTIDLNTGERLQLKDLFEAQTDYITIISENIKAQMREQMKADENKTYWLDSDIEEWNFRQITDETAFYLNENGNIVISFNEGDVAPMYMGIVTFEIPDEIYKHDR